jgi:hypothetical protein
VLFHDLCYCFGLPSYVLLFFGILVGFFSFAISPDMRIPCLSYNSLLHFTISEMYLHVFALLGYMLSSIDQYIHMYSLQDNSVFTIMLLYVRVGDLLTCGEHWHDDIISLRGENYAHQTNIVPPLFIEVSVPNKESDSSFICV